MTQSDLSRRPVAASLRIPAVAASLAAALLALSGCAHHLPHKAKPATPTNGNREAILSRVESAARADADLAGVSVVLPAAQTNADWAQPNGSAAKTYGNLTLATQPKPIWTAKIAGSTERKRLAAAPVIGDGRLYVYDTQGMLYAFDAAKGTQVWAQNFAPANTGDDAVFGGGAAYDAGKVYVTTGLGDVAAFDAKTGKQLWRVKPSGPLRGSPTVAFGAVYVMTQKNEIHALNAEDGKRLWQESASLGATGVFGVAAPAAGQGTVVAGFSTGELIAYRYENGRTLWNDALARTSLSTSVGVLTDIDADPIIDRGRVYALGQGGRMAAYELVTGQRIWELNISGISTPAVAGEWVFVMNDDAKLLCIARNSGKVRWVAQFDRYTHPKKKEGPIYWRGPVLAGDRLWITNSLGDIYMVSAMDGVARQFTSLKAPLSLAPVVANGIMYVLDDMGTITAYK